MLLIYPEIVMWAIYLLEAGYAVPDMQGRTKGDYISTRARQCFGVNTSALECIGASRGAWNAEEGILSLYILDKAYVKVRKIALNNDYISTK